MGLLSCCGPSSPHGHGHGHSDAPPKTVLEAAERGCWPLLVELLRESPDQAKQKNEKSATALHLSCKADASADVVSALIKAYPEATKMADSYHSLPLHLAAASVHAEQLEVVKLLLTMQPVGAM